jgi:hypothetical protein
MIGSKTDWSGWALGKRGFNPKSIAGLVLWLPAASYSAATGTWTDQSGTTHNGTQGTSGFRATASTSAQLGGKPTVLFDGVDDFLSFAVLVNQPLTMLVAVHPITTGGRLFEGLTNGNIVIWGSNTTIQWYANGGNISGTVSAYNNTGFVLSAVANTSSSVLRKGGVQIASGNPGTSGLAGAGGWVLGKGAAGGFTNSHVAEMLVYSRDLNASGEISLVEKYLGSTYGVAA